MSSNDRVLDANQAEPVANTDGQDSGRPERLLLLIAGDAVMFLIFAFSGRRSHNEAAGFDAIWQVILTALPFALAWFIVSPFIGVYRRRFQLAPGKMVQRTVLAWLASWPLAIILRIIFVQRVPEWTFLPVSLLTNLVFLGVWRLAFSWINTKIQRKPARG
jgi:hypothetical protein